MSKYKTKKELILEIEKTSKVFLLLNHFVLKLESGKN